MFHISQHRLFILLDQGSQRGFIHWLLEGARMGRGHQEPHHDLLHRSEALARRVDRCDQAFDRGLTRAVRAHVFKDLQALQTFGFGVLIAMGRVLNGHQTLPQVRGIKAGSMAQMLRGYGLGQDIDGHGLHFGGLKHLAGDVRPL